MRTSRRVAGLGVLVILVFAAVLTIARDAPSGDPADPSSLPHDTSPRPVPGLHPSGDPGIDRVALAQESCDLDEQRLIHHQLIVARSFIAVGPLADRPAGHAGDHAFTGDWVVVWSWTWERVGFLDSTGLGVLVGGLKRVRAHGGSVSVSAPRTRS